MQSKTYLGVFGIALLTAAVFGYDRESHSTPQPEVEPFAEPAVAVSPAQPAPPSDYSKQLAAKDKRIAELEQQLAERSRSANYWYAKAKGQQAKPAVQLDYSFGSGSCANGQCSRSRGRRR